MTRGRLILAFGGGGLLVALAVIMSSRNASREQPVSGDLGGPVVTSTRPASPPLRFALTAVWSPERSFDQYFALADHLATAIDQPVNLVQRKTYAEVVELLRHRNVQAAILCAGAYLSARKGGVPLEVVAVPVNEEGSIYRSLVVVRSESPYHELAELEGRAFAFTDPLSLTGYRYPMWSVMKTGRDPATFFSHTISTYSHEGSVRAIVDGIVEGAAIDSLVFERELRRDRTLADRVRVMHRSEPLGISPVVIRADADPALRDKLTKALVGLDATPEGRNVLAGLGFLRFQAPAADLYNGAAEIVDAVERYEQTLHRRSDRGSP